MNNDGTLYEQIYSIENLMRAGHRTLLNGRKYKREGALFKLHYEKHLLQIHQELKNKSYTPGRYRFFSIYEPKQRVESIYAKISNEAKAGKCGVA